jgi:hypothetical protein
MFWPGTATQVNVTEEFDDIAEAIAGALGGEAGTTVVAAIGPDPSLLDPATVMVYVVPFTNPVSEQESPPTVEHVAFPGVATAVYVTPETFPIQVTTAPPSDGTVVNDWTCGGIPGGTYNKRFGVCVMRFALK